eukprot:PITA_10062
MIAKLKGKFLPKDYQIALHRQVQNLRQRGMMVKEYTEEFYRVNLRVSYTENTPEKTARFVNGLRLEILDEISILSLKTTEEAYQSALKGEWARARGAYVAQTKEAEAPPQEVENVLETGEALVLNKVLLKPAKETTEKNQRKALFWTVCKSHEKCYELIIDSGSIDNLVATEMVDKLGLKRLKHPTPYKVSWLRKGHQFLVDEQFEVEFHIGKYQEGYL